MCKSLEQNFTVGIYLDRVNIHCTTFIRSVAVAFSLSFRFANHFWCNFSPFLPFPVASLLVVCRGRPQPSHDGHSRRIRRARRRRRDSDGTFLFFISPDAIFDKFMSPSHSQLISALHPAIAQPRGPTTDRRVKARRTKSGKIEKERMKVSGIFNLHKHNQET